MTTMKIRPVVQRFAEHMERVLQKNDHKGGWKGMTVHDVVDLMYMELREADIERYRWGTGNGNRYVLIRELVDVANFAMMGVDLLESIDRRTDDDHDAEVAN
jgi:hypothetical protein